MTHREKYEYWCKDEIFDEQTKKELLEIKENEEEIKDRFYKDLEFGTAGLRGIMGAGTNRMNKYTVKKATQGLANYIIQKGGQQKGVVIAYDSRNNSKEFSQYTAQCLSANGIKTYVFEEPRPVPELSFAVRKLNCIAGIVITASHNPPKYNGYKVYWEDGAQITSPIDKEIIQEVNSINDFNQIKQEKKEEIISIGEEIDSAYTEELKKLILNPEIIKEKEITIVYTPLHGTGAKPVDRILKEVGFENVYIVPEQRQPDGNFPTVTLPNPEDERAFRLAIELAQKVDADIVLATDPDADRVGLYSKDVNTGKYQKFTGNMSCMLMAEYILSQKAEKNELPQNGAIIKSIVSTNLASAIAKKYKVELIEVLTGFKYIGEKIKEFEQTQEKTYLFGFEESYGCLMGDYARDKDGISAVMGFAEAAAYYKLQGLTLWDQMNNIYEKYGYYKEDVISLTMEGITGAEKIKQIMDNLRNNPLTQIGNYKIIKQRDYLTQEKSDLITNKKEKITLPTSNVIYYELKNDEWVCVRPSGTEPKIKIYIGIKGKTEEDANNKIQEIKEELNKIIC